VVKYSVKPLRSAGPDDIEQHLEHAGRILVC